MKIHTTVLLGLFICLAIAAVDKDLVSPVPGYPEDFNTSVYSGYLTLESADREMHYVFVQSEAGKSNKDPVTLWLNGGPGCSSLLGFLQQIGPYYLEDGKDYKKGDSLTHNPHSWHRISNLLFFQSPAGVGYSYNNDATFQNNDHTTAKDNFDALKDFFQKYPEYLSNPFWIAGESYAGKYIPDLAVQIDRFNLDAGSKAINFKGIMVGNGVMTFEDGELQNSQAEYMMDHSFVDPDILSYWKGSCAVDPHSAGCGFFHKRLEENVDELNPYNVYGYCYYNDSFNASEQISGKQRPAFFQSQQSMLLKTLAKQTNRTLKNSKYNGAPCSYFDGVFDYFNQNQQSYHAKFKGQKWNGPCAQNLTYSIDIQGSLYSYRILLQRAMSQKYQIILYNGDWDDVVPYHDTIKCLPKLDLVHAYIYQPWFTEDQHSGFQQLYSGLLFVTVKGASHQVPQSKRPQAFELFYNIIEGHKDVWKMLEQAKKQMKKQAKLQ